MNSNEQWIIDVLADIRKFLELNNRKIFASQIQDLIDQASKAERSGNIERVEEIQK